MATKTKKKASSVTTRKPQIYTVTTTAKRKVNRKKGFLADLINPTVAKNSAKNVMASATGGAGAIVINKMLPASTGKLMRVGLALGIGFLASNFGMPNTGAGFTGGLLALSFQNGFLNDDAEFARTNALEDGQPIFLDDDGSPMVLDEDGDGQSGYRYLNEDEINMLQENGGFAEFEEV